LNFFETVYLCFIRAVVRGFSALFRCFQGGFCSHCFHFQKIFFAFYLLPITTMTVYPAGSFLELSFAPPTVRFDSSPAPDMQEEFTALGDVIHVPEDNLEVLVGLTSDALRDGLCVSADRVCRREWKQRGGLDGSLECDVCSVTSTTCVPNLLVFYTASSEATGRSVTLCESCFGGTWMRMGRRIFQTIRPVHLLLVESAESLLWIAHQAELLRVSLGRGLVMMRRKMLSASVPGSGIPSSSQPGSGILVPVDGDLHRRIVGVLSATYFPGGQGRLLQEGISDNKKETHESSCLVLV
jgi:hypothetical protein